LAVGQPVRSAAATPPVKIVRSVAATPRAKVVRNAVVTPVAKPAHRVKAAMQQPHQLTSPQLPSPGKVSTKPGSQS